MPRHPIFFLLALLPPALGSAAVVPLTGETELAAKADSDYVSRLYGVAEGEPALP